MKRILVTGSGRGIGKAIALQLAKDGFDIAVHCRSDRASAEAVAADIQALGRHASLLQFDVADRAAVDALPAQTELLAKTIQQFQQKYQEVKPPDAATWEPRLAVMGARLDNLQQQWQARSAAVNRALTTLFPAEQANAYARLGQPGRPASSGLPRVSNHTSYKA